MLLRLSLMRWSVIRSCEKGHRSGAGLPRTNDSNRVIKWLTRGSNIDGRPKTPVARNLPRFTTLVNPCGCSYPCKVMRRVISAVPRRPLMLLLYVNHSMSRFATTVSGVEEFSTSSNVRKGRASATDATHGRQSFYGEVTPRHEGLERDGSD